MEGASKKKCEGYCSQEALCLLLLCEKTSLSLCFQMHSGEDGSLCIVLIKKKRESRQKSLLLQFYYERWTPKDLQEKAVVKLILVIHTRIKCVIPAVPV